MCLHGTTRIQSNYNGTVSQYLGHKRFALCLCPALFLSLLISNHLSLLCLHFVSMLIVVKNCHPLTKFVVNVLYRIIKHMELAGPSESVFKEFEKWKVKKICFHFYPRSEKFWLSLFFEKCKVKRFCFHTFPRSESEMTRGDREVKFLENFCEILRNEIFYEFFLPKTNLKYGLKKCKKSIFSPMTSHFYQKCKRIWQRFNDR